MAVAHRRLQVLGRILTSCCSESVLLARQLASGPTFYNHLRARDINGNSVNFDTLKGKVVLVGNVASK